MKIVLKKLWIKFKKTLNLNSIIWMIITLIVFIFFCLKIVPIAVRFWNSIKVFGQGIGVYFAVVFGIKKPSEINFDTSGSIDLVHAESFDLFSIDFNHFIAQFTSTFTLPFNETFIKYWWSMFRYDLTNILRFLTLLTIIIPLFYLFWNVYISRQEDLKGNGFKDTIPLKVFKFLKFKIFDYIKMFAVNFFNYIKTSKLVKFCFWLFLFYFNIPMLFLETIGVLYQFFVLLNFESLWNQFYSIFVDLYVLLKLIPFPIYIIIIFYFIRKLRIGIAEKEIQHLTMINKGVCGALGMSAMITGVPGSGKTTAITQLTLDGESRLRYQALEIMVDIWNEYPDFPFIRLERFIDNLIYEDKVKNWYQAANEVVNEFMKCFNAEGELVKSKAFFGYDLSKYKNYHFNELHSESIVQSLFDYSRLYYFYISSHAWAFSNYSIRFDSVLIDGWFKYWDDDFMSRNHITQDQFSKFSHINDFDMQRLTKSLIKNNPNSNIFDGGIIAIMEHGKERGNKNDYVGLKKHSDDTNALNDGYNLFLKIVRQCFTVRGKCFTQIFTDEQRANSLNADNRELYEYCFEIKKSEDDSSTYHFWWYSEMILEWIVSKGRKLQKQFRSNRNDHTLIIYNINHLTSWCENHLAKIHNRYGYRKIQLVDHEQNISFNYSFIFKQIYSDRFDTAALSSIFEDNYASAEKGSKDLKTFSQLKASTDELLQCNSYFYGSIESLKKMKEAYDANVQDLEENYGL